MTERKARVMEVHPPLSKRSKAALLGVNLSSCYLKKVPSSRDTVRLMNEIRDIYGMRPFQGYRRISWDLRDKGHTVNPKRVYRLMKQMGLQAVYPKKNLSKRNQAHKVYPYLLKDHPPSKPHDCWCVDITYIKIAKGFIYLTALIDVVSRHVMGFSVSTTLDTNSCLEALEMAINKGYKPKMINSDQGCQFTSQEWIYQLTLLGVKISMDGKGRALDNIPVERLWRTIKYEEVYLKTYETVKEARQSLETYIHWYNHKRRHRGLNYHRPYDVMTGQAQALKWPFMKTIQLCGCGEKSTFPPNPQNTTTTKIKQQNEKLKVNLSSKIAA